MIGLANFKNQWELSRDAYQSAIERVGQSGRPTSRLTNHIQLPGYTPTILTIFFFGGLNGLGLGIVERSTVKTPKQTC